MNEGPFTVRDRFHGSCGEYGGDDVDSRDDGDYYHYDDDDLRNGAGEDGADCAGG